MALHAELVISCDARRVRACAGREALVVGVGALAEGEARLRRRTRELGWTREAQAGGGPLLDACPACSGARRRARGSAGDAAGGSPPSATSAEASERDRRRREAAGEG